MNLPELQQMLAAGEFHHATYRDHDRLFAGLHIYRRQENGFNGFEHAGAFYKDNSELEQAYAAVRHTGVSVGARGQG